MSQRPIAFAVGGRPVQWQRAGQGNGVKAFTPAKVRKAEKAMRAAALSARGEDVPAFTSPVRLTVVFVYETPKSWPRADIDAAERGLLFHTSTPDLDNLVKLVKDALNTVAYIDDAQVAEVIARKRYGSPERTQIDVRPCTVDGEAVRLTPAARKRLEMPQPKLI